MPNLSSDERALPYTNNFALAYCRVSQPIGDSLRRYGALRLILAGLPEACTKLLQIMIPSCVWLTCWFSIASVSQHAADRSSTTLTSFTSNRCWKVLRPRPPKISAFPEGLRCALKVVDWPVGKDGRIGQGCSEEMCLVPWCCEPSHRTKCRHRNSAALDPGLRRPERRSGDGKSRHHHAVVLLVIAGAGDIDWFNAKRQLLGVADL